MTENALLLIGSRQIGKKYSILEFISSRFDSIIELDFSNSTEAILPFPTLKNTDDFYMKLSLHGKREGTETNCVVFLDEVQLTLMQREDLKETHPERIEGTIDLISIMKNLVIEGKNRYILPVHFWVQPYLK